MVENNALDWAIVELISFVLRVLPFAFAPAFSISTRSARRTVVAQKQRKTKRVVRKFIIDIIKVYFIVSF
jgi:hypothetical protein